MSDRYFPFHALGFQCNPFRALTPEEREEIALLSEPVRALLARDEAIQILGPMGSGKTTTLRGLAARLREQGKSVVYEYLPEGQRRFTTETGALRAFCLDEAQRLIGRERRRLLAPARRDGLRLLLASHEDMSALFARQGLPLLTVRLDTGDEAHFYAALQRRLDYFALPDTPRASLTPDALRRLRAQFGVNLRAAEYLLYEVFQNLRLPEAITAEHFRARTESPPAPLARE